MKKLVIPLIILCLVLVFASLPALAHIESNPFITDLTAGGGNPKSAEKVGVVNVWNDCDYLYVQFDTNFSGECMTETHVHVADSLDGIPQTKSGNPIPGQFEWSEPHGCVLEKTYTIPLTWATGDELYIAAHAALGQEEAMTIVSGDGQTMVTQRRSGNAVGFTPLNQPAIHAWEPGPNYPNDGPDDSSWEQNSLWDQRLSNPSVLTLGADWIWESYQVVDPVYGTVLTLQRTFDIGYPIDGNLLIACDNGYEVFLNDNPLGSHGVYGDWRTSPLTQGYVPQDGWHIVGSYPLIDYLQAGTNTLTIDAANEYFNTDDPPNPYLGTQSNNPAGCIFAAEIDYYADGETAWGGDYWDTPLEFPGKNWAIYFTYEVQPCTVRYPETGNVYIGYEDWPDGDFDYNDFGMTFEVEETYRLDGGGQYLEKVTMTFTAVIYDSGMDHLIHIQRPINGSSQVTVTRPNPIPSPIPILGKNETPAGEYSFTGAVDVILFNTRKYSWPQKQIGEVVIVEIAVDNPVSNPRDPALVPPRVFLNEAPAPFYDMDAMMANYDPWEEGTLYGSLFHIHSIQSTFKFGSPAIDVPYILVVPYSDWIPPYESTMITGPYGYFDDFYRYGSPENWYDPSMVTNNTVGPGGLSWGPYVP